MDLRDRVLTEAEKIRKAGVLANMYRKSSKEYEIGIFGSYATGNIGDLAIGKALRDKLRESGYNTEIFSRKIDADCSVQILGGGDQLHDMSEKKLKMDLGSLTAGSMIIGIGAHEIVNEELQRWAREKLDQLTLITARDIRSKNIIQKYTDTEVIRTSCPAFLHDVPESKASKPFTGVSFKPWNPGYTQGENPRWDKMDTSIPPDEAVDRYHRSIRNIVDSVNNPTLIPFHHFDREFGKKFKNLDVFPYNFDVEETLSRVAAADRMVCTRYHSLVFSILCNKPSIAIAYSPKVAQLAERADIPYYLQYEPVKLNFKLPNNRREIMEDASRNISLINERIQL
ncbi:polysaccharide pyruvyl transferase family protein [Halorubrum sp. T3]|uniref:polysaccharide pyruvyl transferase family protein n=1 Tax=Halorubrum sp. T3 TaxID=1194088 RepID=UPI0009E20DCD|nr:polysaccharide pyruvyl transferase family protein [Halorubrum sp. T3]